MVGIDLDSTVNREFQYPPCCDIVGVMLHQEMKEAKIFVGDIFKLDQMQ